MDSNILNVMNLSSVPEMSEIQLSSMLEQLVGLNDRNSDYSDCNIEEIIKEAEELMDKSKFFQFPDAVNSGEAFLCDFNGTEPFKKVPEILKNKANLSPKASQEKKNNHSVLPSGSSVNYIKSVIDSMREFSHLIDKENLKKPEMRNRKMPIKSVQAEYCKAFAKDIQNKVEPTHAPLLENSSYPTKMKNSDAKNMVFGNSCRHDCSNDSNGKYLVKENSCELHLTPEIFDTHAFPEQDNARAEEKVAPSLLQELNGIKCFFLDKVDGSASSSESLTAAKSEPEKSVIVEGENPMASGENEGIARLENQFSALKHKYLRQMERLEMENAELKEALNNKILQENEVTNSENYLKSLFIHPNFPSSNRIKCSQTRRSFSAENLHAPNDFPFSEKTAENVDVDIKEAYSQTEWEEKKSAGVQCERGTGTPGNLLGEKILGNKENIFQGKKPANSVGTWKQKRPRWSEHETQLMMSLRALRAQSLAREKENRKLKAEMELLRSRARRTGAGKRQEGPGKTRESGTQTVALGPVNGRPYDARSYEAAPIVDLEKENEELKAGIEALKHDLDLLREKRVNDLRSLHEVHEIEMAKVVSKLESQSALAKHLHSLLLKR